MSFRREQFRRLFEPDVFKAFRAGYEGINPDRPLPLPGQRVSRPAWDCRRKAGAYQACGIGAASIRCMPTLDSVTACSVNQDSAPAVAGHRAN